MFVKRIAIAAAISTLLSTSAFAADVVEQAPIPIFSWTGAYVGLNIGFGGGKAKHPFDLYAYDWDTDEWFDIASGSLNMTSSGFLGGAQIGYNYQVDQWVMGVEADIQGANIKGEASISISDGFGGDLDARIGTKLDWYGTVRARLGVAATDRFLVYATGGLAYGHTKSYVSFNDEELSEKKTKAGWTVGAGAEYAITDNVTFKTEYLYTDLGKANLFDGELGDFLPAASIDRKFNFHTVRAGINYKF